MKKRYNQLLEKTLQKNYKNTCDYSSYPQFRYSWKSTSKWFDFDYVYWFMQ